MPIYGSDRTAFGKTASKSINRFGIDPGRNFMGDCRFEAAFYYQIHTVDTHNLLWNHGPPGLPSGPFDPAAVSGGLAPHFGRRGPKGPSDLTNARGE